MKICRNETESVLNDKSLEEIRGIGRDLGLSFERIGRDRSKMCSLIFKFLSSRKQILPWATKSPPTLLRIYLMAQKYENTAVIKDLTSLLYTFEHEHLKDFEKLFTDIVSIEIPDQYKVHAAVIEKQITKRLRKKIKKFPLYLFGVYAQMFSTKRPTRFSESAWETILKFKKYIEHTLHAKINHINQLTYQMITNKVC